MAKNPPPDINSLHRLIAARPAAAPTRGGLWIDGAGIVRFAPLFSGVIPLVSVTLSNATLIVGTVPGSLIGKLSGFVSDSLLTLSDDHSGAVALSGSNLLVGLAASSAGTFSIGVRETPTDGGVPKVTTFTITATGARANPIFTGVNIQGMDSGAREQSHASDVEGQQYSTPSKADLQYLVDRGQTVFRLPVMPERLFMSIGAAINEPFCTVIQRVMTDANTVGLKVLLDVHGYAEFWSGGVKYGFGAANNFTVSEWSRQWQAIATRFKGLPGLYGYDYNEPQNVPNSTTLLPTYMDAMYDAITNSAKGNDVAHFIYTPGNNYTNAENFATLNPNYPLSDPFDLRTYTGHMYMDANSSGNTGDYPTWLSCINGGTRGSATPGGSTPTTGANRIKAFGDWCALNRVRGNIGEVGLYSESSDALDAGFNSLQQAKASGLSAICWQYGPTFGPDGLGLYPIGGVERAAWGPIQQVNNPSTTYHLAGTERAAAGQASGPILVSYTGKLASPITVTGHSTGASTFSAPAVIPAGSWNPSASFTTTDATAEEVKLTTTNDKGFTDPAGFYFSTLATNPGGADNLITTQHVSNPSWSKSGDVTISDYVDTDGITYTRVRFNSGDYHTSIAFGPSTPTTVAGWMQLEIKSLGTSNQYVGLNGGADANQNIDGTKPKNTWFAATCAANAGKGFFLFNRNSPSDILIRKMKLNTGSLSAYV